MIIKGNPAAKITDIKNVEIVFKDGVGYDSEKLIQVCRVVNQATTPIKRIAKWAEPPKAKAVGV